ncbi:MAG: hypothetical protein KDK39_16285 [Leptospiraceae bacterium]|nr:hypothetical protein [Leptospiraceae bacterium]
MNRMRTDASNSFACKFIGCLLLGLVTLACAHEATWRKAADQKSVRFLIPVLHFQNLSREQNLALTRQFAHLWRQKSGYDHFISDQVIRQEMTQAGTSIPATNYTLNHRIIPLSGRTQIHLSVLDNETGQIVSIAAGSAASTRQYPVVLEQVIDQLLFE